MDVLQLPAVMPPAFTISREMAELSLSEDLATYGTEGPVAFAWRWALSGTGPTPVALQEWRDGPPDHDTLLDECRWPYGDGWDGRASPAEIRRARFVLWWVTAGPDDEMPSRFRSYHAGLGREAAVQPDTVAAVDSGRDPYAPFR